MRRALFISVNAVRNLGILWTLCYAAFIIWLYATQPASFKAVVTQATVTAGVYEINKAAFDEGRELFGREQYQAARGAFSRADPARRDARTQFYIAYSFYREAWGRVRSDKNLIRQGLEAVNRAVELAPDNSLRVDEGDLQLHTAAELKAELEGEAARSWSDYTPLQLLRRERK